MATKVRKLVALLVFFVLLTVLGVFWLGSKTIEKEPPTPKVFHPFNVQECETRVISLDELLLHKDCSAIDWLNNDFWIAVKGYVFDVSAWISRHPGRGAICQASGDSTALFEETHPSHEHLFKHVMMPLMCIGRYHPPDHKAKRSTAGNA